MKYYSYAEAGKLRKNLDGTTYYTEDVILPKDEIDYSKIYFTPKDEEESETQKNDAIGLS